jgi:hypothetical protein
MEKKSSKKLTSFKFPEKVTLPAADFFQTSFQNLGLFHFVIDTVLSIDFVSHIAERALKGQNLGKNNTPERLVKNEPGLRTYQLREYKQQLLEIFFARSVDNFEVYLVEILREVLRHRPEILRTRQQTVTLEYVLQFPSIDNLVQDIIENKVNSLSYKGFPEIEQWYKEKGIPLIVETETRQAIIEIIAMRNIIVHNRGRIDEKYIRSIPATSYKLGQICDLKVDDLFKAFNLLDVVVSATDQAITKKFGPKTTSLIMPSKKRPEELRNRDLLYKKLTNLSKKDKVIVEQVLVAEDLKKMTILIYPDILSDTTKAKMLTIAKDFGYKALILPNPSRAINKQLAPQKK